MDIFISWSGQRSGAAAEALKNWLPKIVNAFKPWLSSSDIDKGARWSSEVAGKLSLAKAGIICLTLGNVTAPWILFEAGALSKTLQRTFVCPFLVDLEPSDVIGPLAQFQATRATQSDVLRLLKTLNGALGQGAMPGTHIDEAFEVWWPKLEEELKKLPSEAGTHRPKRSQQEVLEEILDTVRRTQQETAVLKKAEEANVGGIFEILAKLRNLPPTSPIETSPLYRNAILAGTNPFGSVAGLSQLFDLPVTPVENRAWAITPTGTTETPADTTPEPQPATPDVTRDPAALANKISEIKRKKAAPETG